MCVHGVAQIIFMITINMIDWIWRVVFCFQIYTPDILLEAAALGAIRSKLTNWGMQWQNLIVIIAVYLVNMACKYKFMLW